jgi:hypothetical protein
MDKTIDPRKLHEAGIEAARRAYIRKYGLTATLAYEAKRS